MQVDKLYGQTILLFQFLHSIVCTVKSCSNGQHGNVGSGFDYIHITELNLILTLGNAMFNKYYEDPTLIAYGEDVRDWGGAFAVYRGFTDVIPYSRLFNSPISETAIVSVHIAVLLIVEHQALNDSRVIVKVKIRRGILVCWYGSRLYHVRRPCGNRADVCGLYRLLR